MEREWGKERGSHRNDWCGVKFDHFFSKFSQTVWSKDMTRMKNRPWPDSERKGLVSFLA